MTKTISRIQVSKTMLAARKESNLHARSVRQDAWQQNASLTLDDDLPSFSSMFDWLQSFFLSAVILAVCVAAAVFARRQADRAHQSKRLE